MAITHAKNEYVISRGRVYFEAINTATDEKQDAIYMGNCPAFTVSIETEKAEHYSSKTGLREKDASVVLEVRRSGSITCDNMSATNVALFLSGSTGAIEQAAAEAIAYMRPLMAEVDRYHKQKLTESGLTVAFQDERLSTVSAHQALIEGGMRRDERKGTVDKVAAAVILQSYLDARK